MNDPVIGNDDCKFTKILQLFMGSPVKLTEHSLSKLMTFLETQGPAKDCVKNQLRTNTTIYDCLDAVLIEWRGRMGDDAKLSTFVHNLYKCDLKAIADQLQKEFVHGVISDDSQNGTFTSTPENSHLLSNTSNLNQYNDPVKRARDVKCILFCCIFLPLVILSTCIIVHAKIVKTHSITSPSVPIETTSESTIQGKIEILSTNMVGVNESTSLSQNTTTWSVTEAAEFEGRTETELVVTNNKLLNEIFNPENHWDSLVRLEFANNLGKICEQNSDEVLSTRIYMPRLQNLILDISTNCENLLDAVLNYMVMTHVKFLMFKATITNEIIQQMQEFLHLYSSSLHEFHVFGVLENTINMFEVRKSVVLYSMKVITVKLENVWDTAIRHQLINSRFCSIFPALTRFETKSILISLDELFILHNCSHLEHLNTTVRIIGDSVRVLDQLNWREKFRYLKYIAVNFQFDICPDHVFFEKLIKNFDMIDKYSLCSNCNMSPTWRTIYCVKKSKPS